MTKQLEAILPQKLLCGLHTAVMIIDENGCELYHNASWEAMRIKIKGERVSELTKEAFVNGSSRAKCEHFLIQCSVIEENARRLVLTEICWDDAVTPDYTHTCDEENISARLTRLKLRDYIANSANMIRVFEKAKQVANFPTTVLLIGETGVGKEVVASFIHRNSERVDKPYIKVNCSAIPEQLLESELFGYEGGAFTGAKVRGKPGLFELANNGTLLLDEIADMATPLQAKLLRVLQENEVMRLGGQKAIALNVRIISSTNRDMKQMMDNGHFSEALYYRLNVVELHIPPLRERREDILPLCDFFLSHFCERYKLEKSFSQRVKEHMANYDWPGNVRELRNIVENLVVSSEYENIGFEDLPQRIIAVKKETHHSSDAKLSAYPDSAMVDDDFSMRQAVEDMQKEIITNAMKNHGSLRKAAKSLDMDPATLHRLARKLGISTST